jgi:hypothetical protein
MRLRWKRWPRQTGLAAVGAGPYRASDLTDGVKSYATVYPHGGNLRTPLTGWYFTVPLDAVGEYRNTCDNLAPDEATAKAQAMAFVRERIDKAKEPM